MLNNLFKLTSKFQFIKILLFVIVFIIALIALSVSNKSTKVGGITIGVIIVFILVAVFFVRKWLRNEE